MNIKYISIFFLFIITVNSTHLYSENFFEKTHNIFLLLKEHFNRFFNNTQKSPQHIKQTSAVDAYLPNGQDQELQQAIQVSKITQIQEQRKRQIEQDRKIAHKIAKKEKERSLEEKSKRELQDAQYARTLEQEEKELARKQEEERKKIAPGNSNNIAVRFGEQIELPPSLQGKRIYHLKARQQIGNSCGYHTLFNAKSLGNIIHAQKIPTAELVQKGTEELFKVIPDFLQKEETLPLLETAPNPIINDEKRNAFHFAKLIELIDNTYFITSSETNIIEPAGTSEYTSSGDIYQALENIKTRHIEVLHFPYLIGSKETRHWVYIGIVKEREGKPYIIYIDSYNNGITLESQVEKVINKLYNYIK